MSGYPSWAVEQPAIHHSASFEIEDATLANARSTTTKLVAADYPHCR